MDKKSPVLTIVVPCYNEEKALPKTGEALLASISSLVEKGKVSPKSKILFVDDGSKDLTWEIIEQLNQTEKIFNGIKLARNSGHQNALLAGMLSAKEVSDCVISIDADLQDDLSVIDKFIDEYLSGSEIVYGVRNERRTDSIFKRVSAHLFYKFMSLMGVQIVYNHADYRLVSKRALGRLEEFKENNLFLRGIFPIIGFKSSVVEYSRLPRVAGESKYPLKKMLSFALEGITSFSVKPLRVITFLGFLIFFISLLASVWAIIEYFTNHTIRGWVSIVLPIYLIGGIQLLSLGIIGEYIGKVYKETKKRPRYIVEQEL